MNKRFSYILLSLCMLGVLLAPASPVLQIQNEQLKINAELRLAEAQNPPAQNPPATPQVPGDTDYLKASIGDCGITTSKGFANCFVLMFYWLFVSIPSWLMGLTAQLFDFMAGLTISDNMYRADFIQKIWKIVRDFANIFFILVLLYAAFAIILGLGHGGGKKIVAMVILMALLVNFSLFFAKVVIDSSNVLALIFYNKISCRVPATPTTPAHDCTVDQINDPAKTNIQTKDIAGAMVLSFNVNQFFTADYLNSLPHTQDYSWWVFKDGTSLEPSMALALEVTYGLVAWSLAWIFLIVALAFLSRMITLMLLMIVSPLAFVTAAVPGFSHVDTIGWGSWIKQLLETSFVATVFMAILYLVAEIMAADIFKNHSVATPSVVGSLILIFIPGVLVVILLWKGTKYTMKASGALTGVVMAGGAAIAGLALGAVTGGVSSIATGTIGRAASAGANSEKLKEQAKQKGMSGYLARMQLKSYDKLSKSSFDVRKTKAMSGMTGALSSATGGAFKVNLQNASAIGLGSKEGGFKGAQERYAKKLDEESKLYKTSMNDAEVKEWSQRKQLKYENDKAAAEAQQGSKFNPTEYEKIYGPKPKAYNSADELNKDRMQSFISNLGQTGFLGSASYSIAKRTGAEYGGLVNNDNYQRSGEYKSWQKDKDEREAIELQRQKKDGLDKNSNDYKVWKKNYDDTYQTLYNTKMPTVDTINKGRVGKIKMAIGGTTAVLGGAALGSVVGGFLGAPVGGVAGGSAIGFGAGGAGAAASSMVETAGEKKFASNMTKQLGSLDKLNARINELNRVMERGKNMPMMDMNGEVMKNADGKDRTLELFKDGVIDKDKLEDALAVNAGREEGLRAQLTLKPTDATIISKLSDSFKEKATLTSMRTAEAQLMDLTGKKADTAGGGPQATK